MSTGSRGSKQLRLPKIAVEVELAFVGGSRRTVQVFVAQHQADAYRRQHLLDLLENPNAFLPAYEPGAADGEQWALVNKEMVVWSSIPLTGGELPIEEKDSDGAEPQLYDIQTTVRAELEHLDPLAGRILYSPPAGKTRVVDYLNQAGRFIRIWTADRLYLVNKAHVLRVVELDDDD